MKHTIWYSCYIDLFQNYGVASSYVEYKDHLEIDFAFKKNTTINELNIIGILNGLRRTPVQSEVHIIGNCKYADQALRKLKEWTENDEIDFKAHGHHLKSIWGHMIKMNTVSSRYFQSRRSDPMLWPMSQASLYHFRLLQDMAIRDLKFPDYGEWSFQEKIAKETFLNISFQKPYTDNQMEKRILERRKELVAQETGIDNVIRFPSKVIS